MSYYLYFKKNGVPICNYCRAHPIYSVFDNRADFDTWTQVTKEDLEYGKRKAQHKLTWIDNELCNYEKILEGIHTFDERHDIIVAMNELEDEFENYRKVLIMIDMLIDIWGQGDMSDDNYEPTPMEWGIF